VTPAEDTTTAPSADGPAVPAGGPAPAADPAPASGADKPGDAGAAPAVTTPPQRRGGRLDPDTLAALEEQRDFLLRSLDDLRREHDAGDVDDVDFRALEDDYTARAARVIRAIEAHEAHVIAARPRPSRARALAVAGGVVLFAVLAGLLVAQAAGRRQTGETATGGVRETTRTELDEAVELAAEGDYEGAIEIYDEVLDEQPDNAEALTFKGWFQFLSGDQSGVVTLIEAVEADPEYPAPHAFLAVVFQRLGRPETALAELDRLAELDPPPDIANLVAGLREELEAEVATG
jgi:tetratricopeptide (TPR) repeat protein